MAVMSRDELERNSRGILDPGRMREHVDFRRMPAPTALADLVEFFWAVRWSLPPGAEFVQPVLSHPAANVSVGPAYSRGLDSHHIEATAVGVCTGIDRRHLRGAGWNIAAKLRAGALGAFLRGPASELTDRIVGLSDVTAIDDAQLIARLISADGDARAQSAVLAEMLTGVVAGAPPQRRAAAVQVAEIGSLIERERSLRSVRALAERTGIGVRSLQRMFAEYAGVSPLWMIRRYRLIDAADAARGGRPSSWSALAAQLGYADQAHLARDFKAVVGLTPSQYAASVRPLVAPPDAERPRAV